MTDKETYFAKSIKWDEQRRLKLVKRAIRNQRLAWANGVLAAIAVGTIAVLVPLKSYIPIVIRVNELTGAYDVSVGWHRMDLSDKKNERTLIGDLSRYVKAREGFTRGEADSNYKQGYFMSCGRLREEWNAYYRPELNPASPVTTMGAYDKDEVMIHNVTFLPTDKDNLNVAQVRYQRVQYRSTGQPIVQNFVSTITYTIDKHNIPEEVADIQYNGFGLCAMTYRRDPDGPPRPLMPADKTLATVGAQP